MTKQNYTTRIDGEDRRAGKAGEAGKVGEAGKARKAGRPAKGRSTQVISFSIPIELDDTAKKAAFENGESYSGFISRAMQRALLQMQSSKQPKKPFPKVKKTATQTPAPTSMRTTIPNPAPLPSATSENDPCHHMRRGANGNWQLHLTVDRGQESIGQSVDVCLRTSSEQLAREHRDVILVALEKARRVIAAAK